MVIVMRAMGMESDQEIMELIGSEPGVAALMASTVQEAKAAGIYTKQQALEYLGMHRPSIIVRWSSYLHCARQHCTRSDVPSVLSVSCEQSILLISRLRWLPKPEAPGTACL